MLPALGSKEHSRRHHLHTGEPDGRKEPCSFPSGEEPEGHSPCPLGPSLEGLGSESPELGRKGSPGQPRRWRLSSSPRGHRGDLDSDRLGSTGGRQVETFFLSQVCRIPAEPNFRVKNPRAGPPSPPGSKQRPGIWALSMAKQNNVSSQTNAGCPPGSAANRGEAALCYY